MNKNNLYYFLKLTGLTFLLVILINFLSLFIGNASFNDFFSKTKDKDSSLKIDNNNKENFIQVGDNKIIAQVGVAVSTNIGTRFKQIREIPVNIYNDVMDISYILANKQVARDRLISQNMILLNEYLNILKIDLKTLLNQSNDRSQTLDSYINQLEFRYKNTIEIISALKQQRALLMNNLIQSNNDIEKNKSQIPNNFKIFDSVGVIKNIDSYLKAKDEYTYSRTYIIFIDKFITYYSILNAYNKKLLDTLINNRDMIIKNAQLVIPDSGTELLKILNLVQTEADFKKSSKEQ